MGLLQEILNTLDDAPVRQVLSGVHWTAVCSRGCGLSASMKGDGDYRRHPVREVGRLHQKSALQLATWAESDVPLEAALGMATINSLIQPDLSRAREINALDVIASRGAGRKVALVGHFPFVDRLRPLVGELWVLELQPRPGDFPADAAPDLLPRADVIAITGSTFINHTIESLLKLCPSTALTILVGPSAPLSPVLFDYGVDIISGSVVTDEHSALITIAQGAILSQVQGVKRITLEADHARISR